MAITTLADEASVQPFVDVAHRGAMSTRSHSPTPLTALTAITLVLFAGGVVALAWDFSILSLVGFALYAVFTYWIVGGCARRGEPLARCVLRR